MTRRLFYPLILCWLGSTNCELSFVDVDSSKVSNIDSLPITSADATEAALIIDDMVEMHARLLPGEEARLLKTVRKQVKLPKDSCSGSTIIYRLAVNQRGSVDSVWVMRGICKAFDDQFIPTVRTLRFAPATFAGEPVVSQFTIPLRIHFM